MRVDVSPPVKANPGDILWIRARLKKQAPQARLSIWSRTPGFDYAPHIQIAAMGLVKDGKPDMVNPMRLLLDEKMPVKEFSFIADEPLEFCVRQEIDVPTDPLAKVRLGKFNRANFHKRKWLWQFMNSIINRAKGLIGK